MTSAENLYDLLPEIHRVRDAQVGKGQLRAYFSILQSELNLAAADVDRLYDDLFIETCSSNLVGDLGALVGSGEGTRPHFHLARAAVADAMLLRAAKGTVRSVELATRLASGWHTEARDIGSSVEHTVAFQDQDKAAIVRPVRRIGASVSVPVDTNLLTIELDVHTSQWYPMEAAELLEISVGCYSFKRLGYDGPIRLDQSVRGIAGSIPRPGAVTMSGSAPLEASQIEYRSLPLWEAPPAHGPIVAFVDLVLGRLTVATSRISPHDRRVHASWWYPFGADVGGGAYRYQSAHTAAEVARPRQRTTHRSPLQMQRTVMRASGVHTDLRRALIVRETSDHPKPIRAIALRVDVEDSGSYPIGRCVIELQPGDELTVDATRGLPTLRGDLVVVCAGPASLMLSGVCLEGHLSASGPIDLTLLDCTVNRGEAGMSVVETGTSIEVSSDDAHLTITRSLVGAISGTGRLTLVDTIVGGSCEFAVAGFQEVVASRSSVLGSLSVRRVSADTTLFLDRVHLEEPDRSVADRCSLTADSTSFGKHDGCVIGPPGSRVELISADLGSPFYGQIAWHEVATLLTGGEHGSEIGAYNSARRARRRAAAERSAADCVPDGFGVVLKIDRPTSYPQTELVDPNDRVNR